MSGPVAFSARNSLCECRWSGTGQAFLRRRNGARRADVEPLPGMDEAVEAAFRDGAIPQDVRGKRAFGSIAEQMVGDQLDAGEDERGDAADAPASDAAEGIEVEIAKAFVVEGAGVADD